MFFSFPAIANQISTGVSPPLPGEESFGNAYLGDPLTLAYGSPSQLAYSGVLYASEPIANIFRNISPVVPSLLTFYNGHFVSESYPELIERVVNPDRPDSVHNIGSGFVSSTYFEDNLYESLPPFFIVPGNIDSYYPDVFCSDYSISQLPIYILRDTSLGLTYWGEVYFEQEAFAKIVNIINISFSGYIVERNIRVTSQPIATIGSSESVNVQNANFIEF